MGNRILRYFEDLTWKQCLLLRSIVGKEEYHRPARRTIEGMLGKRIPPLAYLENAITPNQLIVLTDHGKAQYKRLCEWRPDLFKQIKEN